MCGVGSLTYPYTAFCSVCQIGSLGALGRAVTSALLSAPIMTTDYAS